MCLLVDQERDPLITWVTFRFGARHGRCSRVVTRGLEIRALDGRLLVFGVNPCAGVRCTWIPDGDCPGNLSWGGHTGDGKADGETFLGRTWMFFSWRDGGGRESVRERSAGSVAGRHTFPNSPILLYIIYCAVEVSLQDESGNRER
jgi:hypothetical protein